MDSDKKNGPVTLLDVAREAGVSPSTVSRILNGTAKVSPDKRKAVESAIAEMHFEPNQLAQNLKKGCSMTIGIVVPNIASPFFAETLRGVDDGLKGSGYASVIVSGHWNAQEENDRVKLLLARKVDGIILLSGRIEDDAVLTCGIGYLHDCCVIAQAQRSFKQAGLDIGDLPSQRATGRDDRLSNLTRLQRFAG